MQTSMKSIEKKAEYIIEMLKPSLVFYGRSDWEEPRCTTEWGTKTKEGLKQSIIQIISDDIETLPKKK